MASYNSALIFLEIKADNELAISLPVQFKSVKKWKYVWKKEINKPGKIKQNDQKKGKNFLRRESVIECLINSSYFFYANIFCLSFFLP